MPYDLRHGPVLIKVWKTEWAQSLLNKYCTHTATRLLSLVFDFQFHNAR